KATKSLDNLFLNDDEYESDVHIRSADKSIIHLYGSINLNYKSESVKFYINDTPNLVGCRFAFKHVLHLKSNATEMSAVNVHDDRLFPLIREFSCVFSNTPGLCNVGEHQIIVEPKTSVRSPHYLIPFNQREEHERAIKKLIQENVIEPSTTSFRSSTFFVIKKDGSNRLVQDF
ncbi:hypothetical protein A3Q56_08726, partial [Intoshia linei]